MTLKCISIVVIPGDGIGPEVTREMRRVVAAALNRHGKIYGSITWIEALAGIEALNKHQELLPSATLELIRKHKIGIKGPTATPVGSGFRSVNVSLRRELDLYACVRPIEYIAEIPSPIKHPEDVHFTIFRENTEDVYTGVEYEAGSPESKLIIQELGLSGIVPLDSAIGLKPISERATKRFVKKALLYALERGNRSLTLVHKGNIMKFTEGAFRKWGYEVCHEVLGARMATSKDWESKKQSSETFLVQDRIADAMFQELLLRPQDHEVIATMNLNGDYLSDAAAALIGGLGVAPGANFGDEIAVFEAVHGTAPDIAGKDLANPTGMILSAVMLLEHLGEPQAAVSIRNAIKQLVSQKRVTGDIARYFEGVSPLSCSQFGSALCELV
ncbi:MAG: NADP-dependent isocitrate dehydrogenase [Bdellovibrionales bacterium]|nr:NADP-dependent isocitrate dehydrogenase [Bdellovibrionales bacterium]